MRIFAILLAIFSLAAYREKFHHQPGATEPASCQNNLKSDSTAFNDNPFINLDPEKNGVRKMTANTGPQAGKVLYQSLDEGNSWQELSDMIPENIEVSSMTSVDGELFIGAHQDGLYRSDTPEKGNWFREAVGMQCQNNAERASGKDIISLFRGSSGTYAGVIQGGFYLKSSDTGLWRSMNAPNAYEAPNCVFEAPDGKIFASFGSGLFESADAGKSWKKILSPGYVSSVVVQGSTIVCCSRRGVMRSGDGGQTWECILAEENPGITLRLLGDHIAAIRTAAPTGICGTAIPLAVSGDQGKTWQQLEHDPSSNRLYDLIQAGKFWYCSHAEGISRSIDNGKTWELVQPLDLNGQRGYFKLSASGGKVYAALLQDGC